MPMPKSLHAERDADAISPPVHSRQAHTVAIVVAIATLGATTGLDLMDDPRPLDVQLSASMRRAGETLDDWQAQLARGLQVSLRAVADGNERPPANSALLARAAASQPTAGGR